MKLKEAPTIVIFDMDGTVVRHLDMRVLHILEKLDDWGYTISRFFRWILGRDHNAPIISTDDEFINRKKPRLLVTRALHKFRRKPIDHIVEPCPGVYSTLALLQKRGIPMALVSNGLGKGYGYDILEKFDLNQFFQTTVFRENIARSKPNPEPLLAALKDMNIEPKASDVIWYVGDRRKDVLAALNLREHTKAKVIPIAYALNAAVAVIEKNVGPEHIIITYPDMSDILEKLFKKAPEKTVTKAKAKPKSKKKSKPRKAA